MVDSTTIKKSEYRFDQILRVIQSYPYWLVTNNKKPVHPRSWNDPDALLTFEEALEILARRAGSADGIAFVFQEDGPFVGVDFDDVLDPSTQQLCPETEQVVHDLGSYTEVSGSGTGLHVLLTGERSPEFKTKGQIGRGTVEVYDQDRYFVTTGNRYLPDELPPEPKPAGAAFDALEENHLQVRDTPTSGASNGETTITELSSNQWTGNRCTSLTYVDVTSVADVTPEMVRATGCEYDSTFAQLWRGESIGNKPSDSELDSCFVSKLAFWCRRNKPLMDDCFRSSERHGIRIGRSSPKWDEVHSSDGRTYGEILLDKACKWNSDRFEGEYIRPD